MPLCCDPTQTFRIVLECDRPKSQPPTFTFRYMTYRQWLQSQKLLDELKAAGYKAEPPWAQRLYGLLRETLAGWENLPVPFAPEDLEAVTNIDDAIGLLYAARCQSRLTEADLGNSPSPPPTAAAASAKDAPEIPNGAATNPADTNI